MPSSGGVRRAVERRVEQPDLAARRAARGRRSPESASSCRRRSDRAARAAPLAAARSDAPSSATTGAERLARVGDRQDVHRSRRSARGRLRRCVSASTASGRVPANGSDAGRRRRRPSGRRDRLAYSGCPLFFEPLLAAPWRRLSRARFSSICARSSCCRGLVRLLGLQLADSSRGAPPASVPAATAARTAQPGSRGGGNRGTGSRGERLDVGERAGDRVARLPQLQLAHPGRVDQDAAARQQHQLPARCSCGGRGCRTRARRACAAARARSAG